MLGPGDVITFEESDLDATHPACIPLLAAAMAHGWRLADDEHPNHDDTTIGGRNLDDFREMNRRKLRRYITVRFVPRAIPVEGEILRVEQFIERCNTDAAFFRAAARHRHFNHWYLQLLGLLPRVSRSKSPTEHLDYGRILIVPLYGGDPRLMQAFKKLYQQPWN